jgi:integrase
LLEIEGLINMSVRKRKNPSGKTVWFYAFDAPGSTRENRKKIREFGFATKQEAAEAEATRRIDELKKRDMAKSGGGVTGDVPKTLAGLLDEFFRQHADAKLAGKTVQRYRELVSYLSADLLAMPMGDVAPLHLNREWTRLLKEGGHTRAGQDRPSKPRPMSAKTVRNTAGVVSSAFSRAIRWGLLVHNPVTNSEPPIPRKQPKVALTVAEQDALIGSASGPWCVMAFIELTAALGARRGEVLALRWSDIVGGRVAIARSLSQTAKREVGGDGKPRRVTVLEFKGTKTDKPRTVGISADAQAVLDAHRIQQNEFRKQFGPDYRADLDLVFSNPNGSPLNPDSVSSAISLLCRRLKLPKGVSLHTLRHTHASHMIVGGVPIQVVSERLGHSSVRVTADVYAHAIRGQDDEAVRTLEEFQQESRKKAGSPAKGQIQ